MTDITTTRYELWQEPDSYSFFEQGNEQARKLMSPEALLVWSCEASSWEHACAERNDFLGWKPYVPMP